MRRGNTMEFGAIMDDGRRELIGTIDMSGIKRCYIYGLDWKVDCPQCGAEIEPLKGGYLMYPEQNKDEYVHVYCIDCDEKGRDCEWKTIYKLRVDAVFSVDGVLIPYD